MNGVYSFVVVVDPGFGLLDGNGWDEGRAEFANGETEDFNWSGDVEEDTMFDFEGEEAGVTVLRVPVFAPDVAVAAGVVVADEDELFVQFEANGTVPAPASVLFLFFGVANAGLVFGNWFEEKTIELIAVVVVVAGAAAAAKFFPLETDPDLDLEAGADDETGAGIVNSSSDLSAISSPRLTMICDKSLSGSLTRAAIMD